MKVRIKFSKHGEMRFIGHLDLMRFFQKAIRRSGLPIRFSEGMSPHMIMSFASPLGLGLTSDGEYVDIELTRPVGTAQGIAALDRVMAEGLRILDFRQIQEGRAQNAMALVAAADYTVGFRDGYEPKTNWRSAIEAFLAQESIQVMKKTKQGEKLADIRPMIRQMRADDEGRIRMRLAAGSAANLKPEQVMTAFAAFSGFALKPFALAINRCELYAKAGETGELISLNELGTEVTEC